VRKRVQATVDGTRPRYRRISVRMWGDAKFRDLSKPQPSGQWLWIWLLTGPRTIALPGVIVGSLEGLAGELGWTAEQFRERFGELLQGGMAKADFDAGLMYLPNWMKHDRPANDNVTKGRLRLCDELPECDLKHEITRDVAWWLNRSGNRLPNRIRNGMPNQSRPQDQDQDQDQDQELSLVRVGVGTFDRFWSAYPRKVGKAAARKAWSRAHPDLEAVLAALVWQVRSEEWNRESGRFIPHPATWINQGRWDDDPTVQVSPSTHPSLREPSEYCDCGYLIAECEIHKENA